MQGYDANLPLILCLAWIILLFPYRDVPAAQPPTEAGPDHGRTAQKAIGWAKLLNYLGRAMLCAFFKIIHLPLPSRNMLPPEATARDEIASARFASPLMRH
jgi:hypothetical protein